MIIISQNETTIVNFNNITHIFIAEGSEKNFLIEYGNMNGTSELLGVYSSEAKAQKVLQEIIEAIRGKSELTMTDKGITSEVYGGFYEMPLDY